jgi:hypothetical protein
MATRIETLGGGKRAPRAAWIMLFAIVMVAAALAIGTLVRSDGGTTEPARSANEGATTALQPATHVPGLVKAGLQPRPFSPIPVDEAVVEETIPDGFVRMPGGELRPTPGS